MPRITFKMVIGPEGFVYNDEDEILEEINILSLKMQQLKQVSSEMNHILTFS